MTDTQDPLDRDVAGLLSDLAAVQGDLLELLTKKRQAIATGDGDTLATLTVDEQQVVERLQACQLRRQQLLERAASEGLPADSIHVLAQSLPADRRMQVQADVEQARHRGRLLQHECLTNWVLVQRSLLHLSQLIEIIATGGRMQPTYEDGSDRHSHHRGAVVGGSLVDRAA